jgi:hypothetical protein
MLNGPTCQVDNLNMFDVGLSIAKFELSNDRRLYFSKGHAPI